MKELGRKAAFSDRLTAVSRPRSDPRLGHIAAGEVGPSVPSDLTQTHMKLALLGLDDQLLAFARDVTNTDRHRLLVASVPPAAQEQLRALEPSIAFEPNWESLIAAREVDAVAVAIGEDSELRDEQLRKLAQAGIPLLISHPSCSAIVAFELDMIRSDSGAVLMPLFPEMSHPAMTHLRKAIDAGDEGPLGVVTHLDIERTFASVDPETFVRSLAIDAHLVGQLIGPVTNVSAVGGGDESLQRATVHLSSDSELPARWSVTPGQTSLIRLMGSKGEATLELTDDPRQWVVTSNQDAMACTFPDWDPTADCLARLERARDGEVDTGWQQACRELEAAETALVSWKRKRTLEVYGDPPTEEDSFKGVMAIGSCAILLLVLLAFFVFALFEGVRMSVVDVDEAEQANRWPLYLRLWPVYPLLLFLGLQSLLMVAKRSKSER